MATRTSGLPASLPDVLRRGTLTEEYARMIYALGSKAVVSALLAQAKQIAEKQAEAAAQLHQAPFMPPGVEPPYQTPSAKRGKRRPGATLGHRPARRNPP